MKERWLSVEKREIGNQRDADKCLRICKATSNTTTTTATVFAVVASSNSRKNCSTRFLIYCNINGSDVQKICIFISTFFRGVLCMFISFRSLVAWLVTFACTLFLLASLFFYGVHE